MATVFENTVVEEKPATSSRLARSPIVERVGKTPLLKISALAPEVAPVQIYAKAEWYNPGGSVKDRAALRMILDGEKSGKLTHEKIILDATSGNTGVAYAMLGAAVGYKVKLVIPANAGALFKSILTAYGAELVFSDPQHGSDGAIRQAMRIYSEEPARYFYPDQYNNPENWLAHYETTGPEIIRQTDGQVTHFIAGLGTSGTFIGCGRRLKEYNEAIQLISVQPVSPLHGLEGLKHMDSAMIPGFYDADLADGNIEVSTEHAQRMVKRLAKEEGLLVGLSSGAVLAAAVRIAGKLKSGLIVVIFADSAHKYFDQRFWGED